jgi:hypothetical protein
MNGYSEAPTRLGRQGVLDKLVLIDALSDRFSEDRELHERVLRIISHTPSDADEQVWAWEKYVDSLPYRRDPAHEVFRDPRQTIDVGGDCDDMVLLFMSGVKALGIPVLPEIVADEDGHGFHIRARVGLPPLAPEAWVIVDPVYKSEGQWAMKHSGTLGSKYLAQNNRLDAALASPLLPSTSLHGQPTSAAWSSPRLLSLIAGIGIFWWLTQSASLK